MRVKEQLEAVPGVLNKLGGKLLLPMKIIKTPGEFKVCSASFAGKAGLYSCSSYKSRST